jgi:hypothetical protein
MKKTLKFCSFGEGSQKRVHVGGLGMNKIQIDGDIATVSINGKSKRLEIVFQDGLPSFIDTGNVGVKIGKSGSKVWFSYLRIKRNQEGWGLCATSPLNSLNRKFVTVTIVDWWENIHNSMKSMR